MTFAFHGWRIRSEARLSGHSTSEHNSRQYSSGDESQPDDGDNDDLENVTTIDPAKRRDEDEREDRRREAGRPYVGTTCAPFAQTNRPISMKPSRDRHLMRP